MPNTQTAKKALRQSLKRRGMNLARKKQMKDALKQYRQALALNNTDEIKTRLPLVYKALDKAAKTKVITKNKAGRLKSRLTKRLEVGSRK
ncbi:MAG: 30S ribosomal protein S20 [Candidatus Colwellbacteria bacterium]|nr:30S ribosomal protein S20 [Candidatus Colwellbacteria bacterium]